jgi:methyl-accepting chemotaxis protein
MAFHKRVIQGNFINSVTYEEDEMNLAKMKVGTRLGLGFALVLVFLVAVTAVGILRMAQIQERLDHVIR